MPEEFNFSSHHSEQVSLKGQADEDFQSDLDMRPDSPSVLFDILEILSSIRKDIIIIKDNQEKLQQQVSNLEKRCTSKVEIDEGGNLFSKEQVLPAAANTLEGLAILLDSQDLPRLLIALKGATLMESTRRILRRLMTRDLACRFSLTGLGAKRAATKFSFKEHLMSKLVIDAAMTMHADVTRREVYECARRVLKSAPDWNGGSTMRKLKMQLEKNNKQIEKNANRHRNSDFG